MTLQNPRAAFASSGKHIYTSNASHHIYACYASVQCNCKENSAYLPHM